MRLNLLINCSHQLIPWTTLACHNSISHPWWTLHPERSAWLNPTSPAIRIRLSSAVRLLHFHRRAPSTTFQDCASCLDVFCPFLRNTRILGIRRRRRILPGNWRPSKRGLPAACRQGSPWWGHNIFVLIAWILPCYGHGFIGQLLLSDPQLYILFPGMSFGDWWSCLDFIFGFRIESFFFGGVCVFVFSFVISHHNYMIWNNDEHDQSSSWQSMATPRRTQCSGSIFVFTPIYITKLVEWPVVESTPRLVEVL